MTDNNDDGVIIYDSTTADDYDDDDDNYDGLMVLPAAVLRSPQEVTV